MNLFSLVEESAYRNPDRIAFIDMDGPMTYGDIRSYCLPLARKINEVTSVDDKRIGILAQNGRHFIAALFACFKAEKTAVLLNAKLPTEKVSQLVEISDVDACIVSLDIYEGGRSVVNRGQKSIKEFVYSESIFFHVAESERQDVSSDFSTAGDRQRGSDGSDMAFIAFTSGTTGSPKAAARSHTAGVTAVPKVAEGITKLNENDVFATSIPLFTGFGLDAFVYPGFYFGCSLALCPSNKEQDVVQFLKSVNATGILTVPAILHKIREMHYNEDFSLVREVPSLRFIAYGGATLHPELVRFFYDELGLSVVQVYGTTETGLVATTPKDKLIEDILDGKLRPIQGVEVSVIDDSGNTKSVSEVGELAIRGGAMMEGYINGHSYSYSRIPNQQGWYFTGDLARMDDNGDFEILGRKDDAINRGGNKIYPIEVEQVFEANSDVEYSVVTSIPDSRLGEELVLYVVTRPNSSLTEDSLRSWAEERLPAFQIPKFIIFVDFMEFSFTGKVLKERLPPPPARGIDDE